ncbi:MAG: AI-2E family transporter [Verrucomicrobia bacterium]|nr:AI-2E family transporter [Verrucomicrobiota bacterium]
MSLPPPSPKQAKIIWAALTGLAWGAIVFLLGLLVWGVGRALDLLAPVLWPLAVAGVVAYLLDPVVDALERWGLRRSYAILTVFFLGFLVLTGVFASVVPRVAVEAREFTARIPDYARRVEERIERWSKEPPGPLRWFLEWEASSKPEGSAAKGAPAQGGGALPASGSASNEAARAAPAGETAAAPAPAAKPGAWRRAWDSQTLQSAAGWLVGLLARAGEWFLGRLGRVASWFGILAGMALAPIYTFYFLLEKRAIASGWTRYLPVTQSRFKDELVFVIRSINNYLIAFFRGQVLVGVCDGILYTVGFALVGVPYALLIGFFAVFLTIIPYIGAILICGAAFVIALLQFGDWLHPALVLAVFALVQALEGYVIQPRILGDRVGLHPLTIIVAVMTGTTLFGGVLGGVLAIPLTAALRVIMFRYVWREPGRRRARTGARSRRRKPRPRSRSQGGSRESDRGKGASA